MFFYCCFGVFYLYICCMKYYKVKHKLTGVVYVVNALDGDHARNKAVSLVSFSWVGDFKIIINK